MITLIYSCILAFSGAILIPLILGGMVLENTEDGTDSMKL